MLYHILTFSLVIAVIFVLRSLFGKSVPRRLIYAMWLAAVIRMCVPFSVFEVNLGTFIPPLDGTKETISLPEPNETLWEEQPDGIHQGGTFVPSETGWTGENLSDPVGDISGGGESPVIPDESTPNEGKIPVTVPKPAVPKDPVSVDIPWRWVLAVAWAAGSAVLLIFFAGSGIVFRQRLRKARVFFGKRGRTSIYLSPFAETPCLVDGTIYLPPETASSPAVEYVIRHEQTHLRHGDPVWNLIRTAALVIYWWNPLVWAAVIVSKRDGELACDEAVAQGLDKEEKTAYAEAIIDCIPEKKGYAIGLGTPPVKERIRFLAGKRKTKPLAVVLAVVLLVGAAGCAIVNQASVTLEDIRQQNGFTILSQEYRDVTLTLPMLKVPSIDQITEAAQKNEKYNTEGIPVYDDGVTRIELSSVEVAGYGKESRDFPFGDSTLYLAFELTHTLPEAGELLSVNCMVNEGEGEVWKYFILVEDTALTHTLGDSTTRYDNAVAYKGQGQGEKLWICMDGEIYKALTEGTASFTAKLNCITYERGDEPNLFAGISFPFDRLTKEKLAYIHEKIDETAEEYQTLTIQREDILQHLAELEERRLSAKEDTVNYILAEIEREQHNLDFINDQIDGMVSKYCYILKQRTEIEEKLYPMKERKKDASVLYAEYRAGKQTMHTLMQYESVRRDGADKINLILDALRCGEDPAVLFDPPMDKSGLIMPERGVIPGDYTADQAYSAFEEFELDTDAPYRFVIPLSETERIFISFFLGEHDYRVGIFPDKIWSEGIEATEIEVTEPFHPFESTSKDSWWQPVATYGNYVDSYCYTYYDPSTERYVTDIHPGSASEWYEVFGLVKMETRWDLGVYSEYKTYRLTAENGRVTSCEEVPTVTRETVLGEGVPYTGDLAGRYTCKVDDGGTLLGRVVHLQPDNSDGNRGMISVGTGIPNSDAVLSYSGDYRYDPSTGILSAEISWKKYNEDGTQTVSEVKRVLGRLLSYGGMVHFLCEFSDTETISPEDVLPLTFVGVGH